jgi:hypothetical protein
MEDEEIMRPAPIGGLDPAPRTAIHRRLAQGLALNVNVPELGGIVDGLKETRTAVGVTDAKVSALTNDLTTARTELSTAAAEVKDALERSEESNQRRFEGIMTAVSRSATPVELQELDDALKRRLRALNTVEEVLIPTEPNRDLNNHALAEQKEKHSSLFEDEPLAGLWSAAITALSDDDGAGATPDNAAERAEHLSKVMQLRWLVWSSAKHD